MLALLADQMLALLLTLEGRGHAASRTVTLHATLDAARQSALRGLLAALAPGRAHPEWGIGTPAGSGARREHVIEAVVSALRDLAGQVPK